MFKKPFQMTLNAPELPIKHEVSVDTKTVLKTIDRVGSTAVMTIGLSLAMKAALDIALYLVKTKIK